MTNPTKDKPVKVEALTEASATFKRKFNLVTKAVEQLQGWAKTDRVNSIGTEKGTDTPSGRTFDGGASGATAPCNLGATLVTVDTSQKVQFAWGLIIGRPPDGFSPGNVPPFQLDAAAGNYYFASADYDYSTALWSNPQITIQDVDIANDTTTAYQLLCSVGSNADGSLNIAGTCGNVWFDPCDLASS